MIERYNYVYVLYQYNGYIWGIYPNFKRAYERIEELAKGNPIVDCGDDFFSTVFEVVKVTQNQGKKDINIQKYHIRQELLIIYDDDIMVTAEMLNKLNAENKERSRNSKYRLKVEAI